MKITHIAMTLLVLVALLLALAGCWDEGGDTATGSVPNYQVQEVINSYNVCVNGHLEGRNCTPHANGSTTCVDNGKRFPGIACEY